MTAHHHLTLVYFDDRGGRNVCLAVNEWAFDEKARVVSYRSKSGLPTEYVAIENLVSWQIGPAPDYCKNEPPPVVDQYDVDLCPSCRHAVHRLGCSLCDCTARTFSRWATEIVPLRTTTLVCATPDCARPARWISIAEGNTLGLMAPRRCGVCCDAIGAAIATYLANRKVVPS